MNKSDLIDPIASNANLTKADAGRALDGITQSISSVLKSGDLVALVGFGSFEATDRAERTGRNPQTGAKVTIAATKVPKFRPGKALRDEII